MTPPPYRFGVSRDVWDEIKLAEQEAHEDSLTMESIEEQDLAEEVGLHAGT